MTHLAALAAGFGAAAWGWSAWRTNAPTASNFPPQDPAADVPAAAREKRLEAELQNRIATIRTDRRLDPWTTSEHPVATLELRRKRQREKLAACQEKARELEERSHRWRGTPDLNEPLANALLGGDSDDALAIFLEWHRRDPSGALTSFIRRPAASSIVSSPQFAACLPLEALLSQYQYAEKLPQESFLDLIQGHGAWLGLQDNIADLKKTLPHLIGNTRTELTTIFLDSWGPNDAESLKKLLVEDSPPDIQKNLLDYIRVRGPSWWAWPLVEELSKRKDMLEFPEIAALLASVQTYVRSPEELASDHAETPKEKDYLALFFQKRITAEEAGASIRGRYYGRPVTDTEREDDAFSGLFLVDPDSAIRWAKQQGITTAVQMRSLRQAFGTDGEISALSMERLLDAARKVDGWPGIYTDRSELLERPMGRPRIDPLRFWWDVNPKAAAPAISLAPKEWSILSDQ